MTNTTFRLSTAAVCLFAASTTFVSADGHAVADDVVEAQRAALAAATDGAGFGPQSPRDIDSMAGNNQRSFGPAPDYTAMNLCNIHFHENAEHKGGNFTTFAGNGDGKGTGTGFVYDGELTEAELAPLDAPIGTGNYGDLQSGDTIEIHFVHSSAQIEPGPTLGACLSDSLMNPDLRVETVVAVLVNDGGADFMEMSAISNDSGFYQANIPNDLGEPVAYAGSTTGPSYNEAGSPLQVSWSVRPEVMKIDINSVGAWLADNVFDEGAAHGVRNLVVNPDLLSPIQ